MNDATAEDTKHPYIKHVLLQNFMCHHNFEMKFGRRLNLIYGTNGSGKSTILTALMIALGSRARTTSRSESLGSLVKTGATRAWIHVTFHIPPEYREIYGKYGNEVTIIRTIGAKGDSQYQLKDSTGRKLPKGGASEVRSLCYHFGIYPDNELAMLSQENAKEFLVHATVQSKYEKLQRALLQHIISRNQQAVAAAEAEQQVLLHQMKQREQNIELLESRSQEILNRASEQITRKERIKQIENLLAWRQVDRAKLSLEEAEREVQVAQAELERLEAAEVDSSARDKLTAEAVKYQERIDRHTAERESISSEIRALQNSAQELRYTVSRSREDVNIYSEEIERCRRELEVLQEKEKAQDPESLEARRVDLEQQKRDIISKKSEILERKSRVELSTRSSQEKLAKVNHIINLSEQERSDMLLKLRNLQDELRHQSSDNSSYRRGPLYEKHKQLRGLVEKQRNWRHKPIGPLYETIEMSDEGAHYSPALERLWNQTLDCWWVQTEEDRAQLESLASSLRFNNLRIILRKDDNFNFNMALPPSSSEYQRIVDLLNVEQDSVKRILVDLNHIEAMVVVHGTENAFAAVRADKRIRSALALSKTRTGQSHFTQVSVSASRTDSATVRPHDLVRIKVGARARRDQLMATIEETKALISTLDQRISDDRARRDEVDAEIQEQARALRKLENLERKCEDGIAEIVKELVNIDTDFGVTNYDMDMEQLNKRIRRRQDELEENQSALAEFTSSLTQTEQEIEAKERQMEQLVASVNSYKVKLRHIEHEKQKAESESHQRERKINRAMHQLEHLQGQARSAEEIFFDSEEHAEARVGPRISQGDPDNSSIGSLLSLETNALEADLRKLKSEAQVISATDEEIERAQTDARDAIEARRHVEQNRREMEELAEIIEYRRKIRQENEKRAWSTIKSRIKTAFVANLQRRKFHGELIIDDSSKKLLVKAAPEVATENNVTTLSGGEKSFTQVALLMSVWEAMQVGLVAMDEYDVFMDKANRSMSLRLLAETIARHNMQCILITPQDVDTTAIQGIEFTMHKLNPARRE